MTITEALAEIKTINKRITAKRDFIKQYLVRLENVKDPLEKDGGSSDVIARELQVIADLETRIVELRHGIQSANEETTIALEGVEKSIADWLVWRREVAPKRVSFLKELNYSLKQVRDQVRTRPYTVSPSEKPLDIIVSINEKELASEFEKLDKILGDLDGQLSLKNATVMVAA